MERTYRTTFEIEPLDSRIGYSTPILLVGSCFAQNVGEKFKGLKFPVTINPFGVLYNPKSVGQAIRRIANCQLISEEELQHHNNLWFSFQHHTSYSSPSRTECLDRINKAITEGHDLWQHTEFLVITFGTARVYNLKSTGKTVANCHKLPSRYFSHSLLSIDNIANYWESLIREILVERPNLKIIFTISPIRHWKDGATGNQISKSTLMLAINELVNLFPSNCRYFPAYEIMMDDLRDYRFYANDMMHPSEVAIDYIWEKFYNHAVSSQDIKVGKEIYGIIQASKHRPVRPNSEEFKEFCKQTLAKIMELDEKHPMVDLTYERELFNAYLSQW